jgi:hypothetical protein
MTSCTRGSRGARRPRCIRPAGGSWSPACRPRWHSPSGRRHQSWAASSGCGARSRGSQTSGRADVPAPTDPRAGAGARVTAEPAVRLGAVRVVRTIRAGSPRGAVIRRRPVARPGPTGTTLRPVAAGTPTRCPAAGCSCGFHGYGALSVLRAEYPSGRRCHRGGEPVGPARSGPAGCLGAARRIEAIWLSRRIPRDRGRSLSGRGDVPPARRHAGRVSAERPAVLPAWAVALAVRRFGPHADDGRGRGRVGARRPPRDQAGGPLHVTTLESAPPVAASPS